LQNEVYSTNTSDHLFLVVIKSAERTGPFFKQKCLRFLSNI